MTSRFPKKPNLTYLQFSRQTPLSDTSTSLNFWRSLMGKNTASASTFTVQSLLDHMFSSLIFFHVWMNMLELIHVPVSFLLAKWKLPSTSSIMIVSTFPGLNHVATSLNTQYASHPKMPVPRNRLVLNNSNS